MVTRSYQVHLLKGIFRIFAINKCLHSIIRVDTGKISTHTLKLMNYRKSPTTFLSCNSIFFIRMILRNISNCLLRDCLD